MLNEIINLRKDINRIAEQLDGNQADTLWAIGRRVENLAVPFVQPNLKEIVLLVKERRIAAIKSVRERTGLCLCASKEVIDNWRSEVDRLVSEIMES